MANDLSPYLDRIQILVASGNPLDGLKAVQSQMRDGRLIVVICHTSSSPMVLLGHMHTYMNGFGSFIGISYTSGNKDRYYCSNGTWTTEQY